MSWRLKSPATAYSAAISHNYTEIINVSHYLSFVGEYSGNRWRPLIHKGPVMRHKGASTGGRWIIIIIIPITKSQECGKLPIPWRHHINYLTADIYFELHHVYRPFIQFLVFQQRHRELSHYHRLVFWDGPKYWSTLRRENYNQSISKCENIKYTPLVQINKEGMLQVYMKHKFKRPHNLNSNTYICVCIYSVCMRVCAYIHICVYMYVWVYVWLFL